MTPHEIEKIKFDGAYAALHNRLNGLKFDVTNIVWNGGLESLVKWEKAINNVEQRIAEMKAIIVELRRMSKGDK